MTSETNREEQLRRLLTEAVEPVEPAPGAQTRLLARARAQAHRRKSRGPVTLRWAMPATFAALVIIAVVTVAFAVHGANRSGSTASTAAGSAAASAPAPAAASTSSSASGHSGEGSSKGPAKSASADLNANAPSTFGNKEQASGTASGAEPDPLRPTDLDGDGAFDSITLKGGTLVAGLSRGGAQTVTLPPPVGPGARVLGVTTLSDPSSQPVTVVFVRLTVAGASATDTVVAVVDGRLTVLRQGSDPVLLTIDPTHGYGCDQRNLVLAGNATPFVVDGVQLVASAQLRGVITPAGKATGCF